MTLPYLSHSLSISFHKTKQCGYALVKAVCRSDVVVFNFFHLVSKQDSFFGFSSLTNPILDQMQVILVPVAHPSPVPPLSISVKVFAPLPFFSSSSSSSYILAFYLLAPVSPLLKNDFSHLR